MSIEVLSRLAAEDAALYVLSQTDVGSLHVGGEVFDALRFLRFAEESHRPGPVSLLSSEGGLPVQSDMLDSVAKLDSKFSQASRDTVRDNFLVNNRFVAGAELGIDGVMSLLQSVCKDVLLTDAGLAILENDSQSKDSILTLCKLILIKASRSNSGASTLFHLLEQYPTHRPVAVSSMAKPLIIRIRAGGSGNGRPELICGCSCSTFYRLSSGLDEEEEEGRLVEAIFEDAAALPVELIGTGGTVKLGSWPRPAPSALVTVTVTPSTS